MGKLGYMGLASCSVLSSFREWIVDDRRYNRQTCQHRRVPFQISTSRVSQFSIGLAPQTAEQRALVFWEIFSG